MAKTLKQRQKEYISRLKRNPSIYSEYLDRLATYSRVWKDKDDNRRLSNLLSGYSKNDKKKGREFNLTIQWCRDNILGKECDYCGTKELVGVDRIDNSIGHIESNCHPVCKPCNTIRGAYRKHEEMLEFRKLVDSVGWEEARLQTIQNDEDRNLKNKAYGEKHKERLREYYKRYNFERRKEKALVSKKYYQDNLPKVKEYRRINKEKIKAKMKIYREKNKEKIKEYNRMQWKKKKLEKNKSNE